MNHSDYQVFLSGKLTESYRSVALVADPFCCGALVLGEFYSHRVSPVVDAVDLSSAKIVGDLLCCLADRFAMTPEALCSAVFIVQEGEYEYEHESHQFQFDAESIQWSQLYHALLNLPSTSTGPHRPNSNTGNLLLPLWFATADVIQAARAFQKGKA